MEEIEAYRKEIAKQNWRRIRAKILAVVRFGGTLRRTGKEQNNTESNTARTTPRKGSILRRASTFHIEAKETFNEAQDTIKSRLTRWTKKMRGLLIFLYHINCLWMPFFSLTRVLVCCIGGNAGIPPSFTYRQCMWTFIGVMTTHTLLSLINQVVKVESDNELSLVLAPLGMSR